MSTTPAIVVACDASHCDRVLVASGDHAVSWEAARAWARSWGWTSPHDDDWCPDHGHQYGGHGYPSPYDYLDTDTDTDTDTDDGADDGSTGP